VASNATIYMENATAKVESTGDSEEGIELNEIFG
jgi:hypothetical protein